MACGCSTMMEPIVVAGGCQAVLETTSLAVSCGCHAAVETIVVLGGCTTVMEPVVVAGGCPAAVETIVVKILNDLLCCTREQI